MGYKLTDSLVEDISETLLLETVYFFEGFKDYCLFYSFFLFKT